MAIMNVAQAKAEGLAENLNLTFKHQTRHKSNPGYAMIESMPADVSHAIHGRLAGLVKGNIFSVEAIQSLP